MLVPTNLASRLSTRTGAVSARSVVGFLLSILGVMREWNELEWWEPEPTDQDWIERIRSDYPEETENMSDEDIRFRYADGQKYATTWDTLGDAYAAYERLADKYWEMKEGRGEEL